MIKSLNYIQILNLNNLLKMRSTNYLIKYWINKNIYFMENAAENSNKYNYYHILKKKFKKNVFFSFKNFLIRFILNKKLEKKKKNLTYSDKIFLLKTKIKRKKNRKIFSKKELNFSFNNVKKFLSLLTNCKINLIFINSLSFCQFYYYTQPQRVLIKKNKERYNIWPLQRYLFNRYKYTAIYIKDFICLGFISVLIKNPQILVNFIGYQFKHLPKNRKQLKLLYFITQTLKILCEQRTEIIGFKLKIKGRLNRRNRTKSYIYKKGRLPIQTINTRVEYGYSEGYTRSGLIGIKLWIFYDKMFKNKLKKKLLEFLLYSKYKSKFNYNFYLKKYSKLKKRFKKYKNVKTKSKKI